MVKDADSHRAEDDEKRKQVETRNRLDTLVYTTQKTLEEHKDKVSASELGELESALEEAKKALESDELAAMEAVEQKLTQASHRLAEVMYQQASAAGGEGGPTPEDQSQAQPGGDEVIDAEYVDVGDEAKDPDKDSN
jgi:molecular chaperone DnaK